MTSYTPCWKNWELMRVLFSWHGPQRLPEYNRALAMGAQDQNIETTGIQKVYIFNFESQPWQPAACLASWWKCNILSILLNHLYSIAFFCEIDTQANLADGVFADEKVVHILQRGSCCYVMEHDASETSKPKHSTAACLLFKHCFDLLQCISIFKYEL